MTERSRGRDKGRDASQSVKDIKDGLDAITDKLDQVIGAVKDTVEEIANTPDGGIEKSGSAGGSKVQASWGVRVRTLGDQKGMGAAGSASARTPRTGKAPAQPAPSQARDTRPADVEIRKPLVDVFYEESMVRIVAELPGVSADNVSVSYADGTVSLETGCAPYFEERIALEQDVKPDSMKQRFENGIMELTFEKA